MSLYNHNAPQTNGPPATGGNAQQLLQRPHQPRHQQPRVDLPRVRMLIDSRWAGAITLPFLGLMRTDYNASIELPDKAKPERVLTIRCPVDAIQLCVADVLEQLRKAKTVPGMDVRDNVRMLVQREQAEAIFGRNGSKLGQLRNQTGCQIRMASECCPGSTEHVCHIIGHPNILAAAVKLLVDFLVTEAAAASSTSNRASEKGSQLTAYDPTNYNPMLAYDGFGAIVAPKAFFIPRSQQRSAVMLSPTVGLTANQPQSNISSNYSHQQMDLDYSSHQQMGYHHHHQFFPSPPPPPPPPLLPQPLSSFNHGFGNGFMSSSSAIRNYNNNNNGLLQEFGGHHHHLTSATTPPPPPPPPLFGQQPMEISQGNSTLECEILLEQGGQLKCAHQQEVDLLKEQLAKAEESRDLAENTSRDLQQEVDQLRSQVDSTRLAQIQLVVKGLERKLAEEKANLRKMTAERDSLKGEHQTLISEKHALGEQCEQLKLTNSQLKVEMECLNRNPGSIRPNAAVVDKLMAEERANLAKMTAERDALVQQSLDREAQMLALNEQLQKERSQCEQLKQEKEKLKSDLDWMYFYKDELVAVESDKSKGQMEMTVGEMQKQVIKLKRALYEANMKIQQLQAAAVAAGIELPAAEQEAMMEEHNNNSNCNNQRAALKLTQMAKKAEHARRKALEEEVEMLRQQLDQQSRQRMALARRVDLLEEQLQESRQQLASANHDY